MKNNNKGFAVVETLLITVIAAIIIGAVYYVYKSNQRTSDSLNNVGNSNIIAKKKGHKNTTQPVAPVLHDITVTPYGGSAIKLSAPSAWALTDGDDSKIENTIGKYKYLVSFQVTEEDYLKLHAYKAGEVLAQTTDKSGQTVYIVKSYDNIELSSCKPSGGKGCSLLQDGKPLFVFASTPGRQAPGVINFSDSSADTLVNDLKTIISNSTL